MARQLIEMRYFTNTSISPDGRYVAFQIARPSIEGNDVELEWHVMAVDGSKAERRLVSGGKAMWLQGYGALISPKVAWTSDSHAIVFQSLEKDALVLMRADLRGRVDRLTDQPADVEDFTIEGARIWYETGTPRRAIEQAERTEYDQGIRLTPAVKVEDGIFRNTYYRGRIATIRWDMGGGADTPLLGDAPRTIWKLDVSVRKSRIASAKEKQHYESLKTDSDADPIADVMYRDRFQGRSAFATRVPRDGNAPEDKPSIASPKYQIGLSAEDEGARAVPCTEDACIAGRYGIRGVKWRSEGREILFIREDSGVASTLYAWNVFTGHVRAIQSFAGTIGRGGDGVTRTLSAMCPITPKYAVCVTAGPKQPPRLERIDLDTGTRRLLFDPNEDLGSQMDAHVEQVTWKDKWGRRVTGVLVMPEAAAVSRIPLVLTGYTCGGFLQGGAGRDVPEYALAAEGIAALCVNMNLDEVRGHPYPSGDIPSGPRADLQSYLDAWESGVDYLGGRHLVDVGLVGISGLSFGAEAVHYATVHSNRFAVAAASQADIKDPINYYVLYSRGASGAEALRYYGMPPPEKDGDGYYDMMSPARNVAKIHIPVLIQTAESEFRYGIEYYATMIANKKAIDYYVFPGEQHNFTQPKHRFVSNTRFLDWFAFWLKGTKDDAPEKALQYAHWESMREQLQAAITK